MITRRMKRAEFKTDMKIDTIKVHCAYDKLVNIDELISHDKNRNKHPQDQIHRLAEILQYQGIRRPVQVSNRSGKITAGHGMIEALRLIKCKEVPVSYQDFDSDEQEYAHVQADNAIALWAELDFSEINEDIGDLGPDFDIDLLGIKDFEIEVADKGQCDEDEVPEHVEPKTKLGDIYQLGNHRLMCGDSTSIDVVDKLMNGQKAELLWTDPPYGVSYTEKNEWLNSIGKPMARPNAIANDSQTPKEMNELWFTVLSNAHTVLSDKCSYYISSPQGGDLMMMMMSIIRAGLQLKHMLIWVKNNHVLGRCDYNYKHEPILYGWKDGGTHEFYGRGRCKTSVWDFNKPLKNDLHPTMKPVELIEESILNSADYGSNVLDLFGGSGSTLIACEKTNRKCFMMEIDPHYCDVIVARWEKYTGLKSSMLTEDITA